MPPPPPQPRSPPLPAARLIGFRGLRDPLLETASTTGMIYLILFGAELLKIFMSRGGVPQAAAWLAGSGLEPMMILILLIVALIALGCLTNSLSMILIAIPFFWPVLVELNAASPSCWQHPASSSGCLASRIGPERTGTPPRAHG